MPRFALIASFLACSATGTGQSTFLTIFNGTGTAKGNLLEISSGNLFTGLGTQSGTLLLSADGAILHEHCFHIDTMLAMRSVKRLSDNGFYFTATYWKDTCAATGSRKTYPAIGKLDSLGNASLVKYYRLNSPECSNRAGDLEIMNDGSVIVMGSDNRLYLLKADSLLAHVWSRRFSEVGGFAFIKELPSGDLLAGINLLGSGIVVARLDPDGNFIWCKSYIRPRGMLQDAVIESDDSFLITGLTDSLGTTSGFVPLPPWYHPKLFLMKIDGSGDVQWCRGYDSAPNNWYTRGSVKLVRTLDGNYAVLANLAVPEYNLWHRPFLMKTNLNGDTLWTHSYGENDYTYITQNLLQYSDGGILFNGRIWGTMPDGTWNNWAFVYKTDSLGQLPCSERHHPVVVTDLFPVDSSFTLNSIDGAIGYPAFVQDTIYPPLVVIDGCSLGTAIPDIVRNHGRPRIRPNPNTGRFTVQFTDPLQAESYYSVYDAMGKLLFQRPLPKGRETEEVDLSRFGAGTYMIRFTDKEGSCYERVVVE